MGHPISLHAHCHLRASQICLSGEQTKKGREERYNERARERESERERERERERAVKGIGVTVKLKVH